MGGWTILQQPVKLGFRLRKTPAPLKRGVVHYVPFFIPDIGSGRGGGYARNIASFFDLALVLTARLSRSLRRRALGALSGHVDTLNINYGWIFTFLLLLLTI